MATSQHLALALLGALINDNLVTCQLWSLDNCPSRDLAITLSDFTQWKQHLLHTQFCIRMTFIPLNNKSHSLYVKGCITRRRFSFRFNHMATSGLHCHFSHAIPITGRLCDALLEMKPATWPRSLFTSTDCAFTRQRLIQSH